MNMDRYQEFHRPQIHYTPQSGWLNDPNGLVFFEGEYHLFYQYNPVHNGFGPINWGHAVSQDLLHWQELPIALQWDEKGYIWSGSAIVDQHDCSGFFHGGSGLVAFFTYADDDSNQSIALAFSQDKGRTWTKYTGNPVLRTDGEKAFRDPKVFYYEPTGKWMMVVAGGPVRFYSSDNLRDWQWESINDLWTECPDFIEIPSDTEPKLWALDRAGKGFVFGRFDGHTFTPLSSTAEVTGSPDRYAAQIFSHAPDGRQIEISWFGNWQYQDTPVLRERMHPFNGGMTFPVELSCQARPDGTLQMVKKPITELERLREDKLFSYADSMSDEMQLPTIPPEQQGAIEIFARIQVAPENEFGLTLSCAGGTDISMGYDASCEELYVDRIRCGVPVSDFCKRYAVPLQPDEKGEIRIQIILDHCMAELFGNEGICEIASWVLLQENQYTTSFFMRGGRLKIKELTAYRLRSIWEDEKRP